MPRLCAALLGVLLPLFTGIAWAAGERNPFDYSVLTYLWVMGLSGFGGAVNFSRKLRAGRTSVFRLTEFLGELLTSSFAGLLTFWLCESAGIDKLVAAVMIAISGHMGSRAIYRIEYWLEHRIAGQQEAPKS